MSSRIKILSPTLVELATLAGVINASRAEKINSDNTLSFSTFLKESVQSLINDTNMIGLDGDYFDIAAYTKGQASDGKLTVNVECEHVSYRLNDPDYNVEYFTEMGTPAYILGKILEGTPFTAGTVEFTEVVTYSAQEAKSRRGLLMEFIAYLGGEASFSGFTVSILTHRGSSTPQALLVGKNITVMSKVVNKRERDDLGNPIIAYTCGLLKPMALTLGDVVTLDYDRLDIDVSLRIVSLTKNPYSNRVVAIEVGNYVSDLQDDLYRIETSTLAKGKTYYGARISADNGFESIRSDKKARGIFNADTLALQVGDGTGSSWTNKLYFDPVLGKYVFDGELSATMISVLETLITPNLYADKATIAELTVDQLDTGSKVQNYLNSDTSDVNYIKIYDQYLQFITASTDGSSDVQATDRNSAPLYWTDETHVAATTTETDYPVMIYVYTEFIKAQIAFEDDGTNYVPQIIMGAGTGVPNDGGKTFIYKAVDGFYIDYRHSVTGASTIFKITDEGIDLSMFPKITYAETVAITGIPQIWVQPDTPIAGKPKDAWIDTDDYSRYDVTQLTAGATLVVTDNEVINASGTFTITLHSALDSGIIKKIYNTGTGIITLSGTINGKTGHCLYPGESIDLITDGSGWRG